MIPARAVEDRAWCGRPGCRARSFGQLLVAGSAGGRDVWIIDLSLRWLWHVELEPRRWRRAPHAQRTDAGQPDREWNMQLPTVIECPRCKAVQRVARG